jgi:hypothetical protein
MRNNLFNFQYQILSKIKRGRRMMNLKEEKCLIAYYSREGNNIVGGSIKYLPIGTQKL